MNLPKTHVIFHGKVQTDDDMKETYHTYEFVVTEKWMKKQGWKTNGSTLHATDIILKSDYDRVMKELIEKLEKLKELSDDPLKWLDDYEKMLEDLKKK